MRCKLTVFPCSILQNLVIQNMLVVKPCKCLFQAYALIKIYSSKGTDLVICVILEQLRDEIRIARLSSSFLPPTRLLSESTPPNTTKLRLAALVWRDLQGKKGAHQECHCHQFKHSIGTQNMLQDTVLLCVTT